MKVRRAYAVAGLIALHLHSALAQDLKRSSTPAPVAKERIDSVDPKGNPLKPGNQIKPSGDKPPPPPLERQVNASYVGAVTEITKDSITILWVNSPGEKPKVFALSEALAAGKIPKEPFQPGHHVFPIDMYRITDVKVGDLVHIHYARWNGVDICHNICIRKRPGGRIPPLPEEAERLLWPESKISPKVLAKMSPEMLADIRAYRPIPYHEYWNAYWDLEDKGIPFPEKFGKDRRFPLAPPPREITKKPLIQ